MSASRNVDALANQGEFSSRVPPSEPLADGSWVRYPPLKVVSTSPRRSTCSDIYSCFQQQHKPGVKVGNDAAPEFSAKTYPPGTAPRENMYQPNPQSEIPGQSLNEQVDSSAGATSALDMPGSTSQDVHNATQFGKPVQGQTSTEHHGSGKKDSSGVGSRITGGYKPGGVEIGDGSVQSKVRGLGADLEGRAGELKGQKGVSGAVEGGSN